MAPSWPARAHGLGEAQVSSNHIVALVQAPRSPAQWAPSRPPLRRRRRRHQTLVNRRASRALAQQTHTYTEERERNAHTHSLARTLFGPALASISRPASGTRSGQEFCSRDKIPQALPNSLERGLPLNRNTERLDWSQPDDQWSFSLLCGRH